MPDRRTFLGAVSGAAASFVLASPAGAQTAGTPSPAPPGAAAASEAGAMRAFDPRLTDDQVAAIARGIQKYADEGAQLNPKGRLLRNGDEPVTQLHLDRVP